MRKSNHKLSMIMLLLALAAAAFIPSKITHAQPTILLKVEPETYTATRMGETFDINVTINNVEATDKVIGIEFKLHYNTSLLEVVDVAEGPFLAQFNNTPTEPYVYFIYYVEEDYVVVGLYLMPNATGYHNVYPEGSGTITTITFKVTLRPTTLSQMSCELLLNDTKIIRDPDDALLEHDVQSGMFIFSPVYPTIKVVPSNVTETTRDNTFNVNIELENVDKAWKLIGIQFKLHYNTSLLEVVDVAEGPFLAQFNNTPTEPYVYFIYYVEEDYVVVGLYLMPNATGYHNVYPEGSGTITTITFKTLPMPSSQCDLTLDWVLLIDSDGVEIPCYIESGHYSMPYEVLVHQIQWEEQVFTVTTESNGTVNPVPMIFNQTYGYLMFNLTGADGEVIYCKVEIPKELLYSSGEWLIIVGGERVPYTKSENETHTILYFKTTASTKSVYIFGTEVVPEFPIPILWMAILASAAALTLSRNFIKRKSKA